MGSPLQSPPSAKPNNQLLEGASGRLSKFNSCNRYPPLLSTPLSNAAQAAKWSSQFLSSSVQCTVRTFFQKDDAARKKVAQLEAWKRLSDAIREFESLGPDLPKRAAAPATEAKVMEFLALATTFTQDPGLFELDTPIKCFRKRFEADIKSISQEMIKQASSRVKEAVESMRSQVHGVGDGKAWSGRIPHDKAHNLVVNIAKKTLLTLTGQLFIRKLEQLSGANGRMQRVHELFDLKREDTESCDLIHRGLVTKSHGAS